MLLLLAGCSNTASNEDEANLLSLDDDIYYIVKDSIDDLSTNFKLEEGQSLSIEGDYDLNTNGRYTVKFVVRDTNDEIVSESIFNRRTSNNVVARLMATHGKIQDIEVVVM